jgi:predicted dehydrogenase
VTDGQKLPRRRFLQHSAALGAAAAAAPAVAPAQGANERLHLAVIGCGARGTELIQLIRKEGQAANATVRAACDVYEPRLQAAVLAARGKGTIDFRELLADDDIHAVAIDAPDHWHGPMAAQALEAGKHVYVEPPLALRAADARRAAHLAQEKKLILQVGATSCADTRWTQLREHIADGGLGPLVWTQSCHAENARQNPWNRPVPKDFDPKKLDWRRFLGPAPERPLDPQRFVQWRKFQETSNGLASLELYERLARLLIAVGPRLPARVSAAASNAAYDDQELPDNLHAVLHYPNQHTVVLSGTTACSQTVPEIVRGYEATAYVTDSGVRILCQPIHKGKHPPEVKLEGAAPRSLMADFLACIRDGRSPACGPDVALPTAIAMDLATQAARTGEILSPA